MYISLKSELSLNVLLNFYVCFQLLNAASLLLPADSPSTQRLYHLTVELYSPELGDADQSELSCHLGVEVCHVIDCG
jgi:hypothetical protein